MATAPTQTNAAVSQLPRILVIGDASPGDQLNRAAQGQMELRLQQTTTLAQARTIIMAGRQDLLLASMHLPDGEALELIPLLRRKRWATPLVTTCVNPTVNDAVTAFRGGVSDFLALPMSDNELLERVRRTLQQNALQGRSTARMRRLRDAVHKLNESRKVVAQRVDLICQDVVSAYGRLAVDLDGLRTQESFRNTLEGITDLERMLCNTMDWLLKNLGYCNVAVWLNCDDEYQMGAYMKHTMAGEKALLTAIKHGTVARVSRDGFIHFDADDVNEHLTPSELDFLAGQSILATSCVYLSNPVGVIVMFRDGRTPFTPEQAMKLKTIAPVLAQKLAGTMKLPSDNGNVMPMDNDLDDDAPDHQDDRRDSSDWWKNGNQPPF